MHCRQLVMATFKNICRTCTKEVESVQLINIFKKNRDLDLSLAELIVACSNTEVAEDDVLPHEICAECEQDLRTAFNFRQKAEDAFRELLAIQERMLSSYERDKEQPYNENEFPDNDEEVVQYHAQTETVLIIPKLEEEYDEILEEHQVVAMNIEPDPRQNFEILEVACNQQGLRYKCSVCDKTFSRQTHVKRHQLTHSSIKPFRYLMLFPSTFCCHFY